jgi:hypothetical protein
MGNEVMPFAGSKRLVLSHGEESILGLRWVLELWERDDELHIGKVSALSHASSRWPRKRIGK